MDSDVRIPASEALLSRPLGCCVQRPDVLIADFDNGIRSATRSKPSGSLVLTTLFDNEFLNSDNSYLLEPVGPTNIIPLNSTHIAAILSPDLVKTRDVDFVTVAVLPLSGERTYMHGFPIYRSKVKCFMNVSTPHLDFPLSFPMFHRQGCTHLHQL